MPDTENSPKWYDVLTNSLNTLGGTYANIVTAQNSGNINGNANIASQTPTVILQGVPAANAANTNANGTPAKKDNSVMTIIIVILVLLVLGTILYFVFNGKGKVKTA